jgi:hypothetical protein
VAQVLTTNHMDVAIGQTLHNSYGNLLSSSILSWLRGIPDKAAPKVTTLIEKPEEDGRQAVSIDINWSTGCWACRIEMELSRVCRIPLNFAMSDIPKCGGLEKLYWTPTCEVD